MVQVTIVKIVPSTSALTATPPPQDTLKPLVCLPNATFAADGDIAPDFVPHECVTYVTEEVMSLTIARLLFFPLNRPPISLGTLPTRDRHLPHGVLIKPGVRLYEGGNVTVHLLYHGTFLFSFLRRTHVLFGMYVFLRLDTYSDSFEFFELFFC